MSNYRKGYMAERDVVNSFRDKGFFATRSAGSHSKADVIVVEPDRVRMIQLKVTGKRKIYESSYKDDWEALKKMNVPDNVTKEIWTKVAYQRGYTKKIVE